MRSKITDGIKPFIVMEILERAQALEREGRSIVHMEIGEPDFDTPAGIVESGVAGMTGGDTHYTDSRGTHELRETIASWYNGRYGLDVTGDRVLVTNGVSPALLLVLSVLIEQPGDEIVLGDPYYPCYPNFIRFLRGVPRFAPASSDRGFQIDPADARRLVGPRTKAIMINSPANPSGTLMPPADIGEICSLGVPVISDEIYHGLVYGAKEHSALEYGDDVFVLNGFSKLFAMTGWRLGYCIAPASAVRTLHVLLQNFFISPNAFVQRAGLSALSRQQPEIDDMVARYDARRRFLLEELPKIGLGCRVEPKGAFYIFVDASHVDRDSYRLAFDILETAGVALAPGIDFGAEGEGHLRISYANSIENLADGVRRLEGYLARRDALPAPHRSKGDTA